MLVLLKIQAINWSPKNVKPKKVFRDKKNQGHFYLEFPLWIDHLNLQHTKSVDFLSSSNKILNYFQTKKHKIIIISSSFYYVLMVKNTLK